MNRANAAFKVLSAIFFLAVLAYIGVYLYTSIDDPFRTTVAVSYTVYDSFNAKGIIIRDEIPISADYDIVYVTAKEAERLPVNGQIAVAYLSQADLELAVERRFIEAQIEYLESISNSNLNSSDPIRLQNELKDGIIELKRSLHSRDLINLKDSAVNLKTLAFIEGGQQVDIQQSLAELNRQLYELGSESMPGDIIKTGYAGLYSGSVDGFESMSPDMLWELTPGELSTILNETRTVDDSIIGKIIRGRLWYYAANIDVKEAGSLSTGSKARLIFGRYYNEQLNMRVEKIGDVENGNCIVLFSCDRALGDTISMRRQTAEILKAEYNGIKVPRKAVRLDDEGNTCVYVVTGLKAEARKVDIIYDAGDFYIVKNDLERTDALRVGDSIIISAKDLYDGKVLS